MHLLARHGTLLGSCSGVQPSGRPKYITREQPGPSFLPKIEACATGQATHVIMAATTGRSVRVPAGGGLAVPCTTVSACEPLMAGGRHHKYVISLRATAAAVPRLPVLDVLHD